MAAGPGLSPALNEAERNWRIGELGAARCMGIVNSATAELVEVLAELHRNEGWAGGGIQSLGHWATWKAGLSKYRAENLVRVAQRTEELPECFGLFRDGRISEDMICRIARKVPARRDGEIARLAPKRTVAQMDRLLKRLPDVDAPERDARTTGSVELRENRDGTGTAIVQLPADQWAIFRDGLQRRRDLLYRQRHQLDDDIDVGAAAAEITYADALVAMAEADLDATDAHLQRTGRVGERHQVVIHRDLLPDGTLGPGRIHGSIVNLPDGLTRYLSCDATVRMDLTSAGQLLGLTPTERPVSRALRRHLEHRDGGCMQPLCTNAGFVHQHHIRFWEDGGLTVASNLVSLCPSCHRRLHLGEFTIEGDPEHPETLVFRDRRGRPIEPPQMGPPRQPGDSEPAPFTPASGEAHNNAWFSWN